MGVKVMDLGKQVESILEYVAWTIIWNKYFAMIFLVLGLYLTIGNRFFQFRRFGDILYYTVGSLFRKKNNASIDTQKNFISSYGAFATALGGTVGNGNIAGVSSAIAIGGPGALFWMWVAALVGMVTKMSEIVLTQAYKQRYEDGSFYGSAAFYIHKGLVEGKGWKWCKILSFIFTVTMIGSFYFSPGPYTVVEAVQSAFKLSNTTAIVCAIIYATFAYVIILGGIPRIVKFAEFVVPGMVLLYFCAGTFIILKNIPETFEAIKSVFYYAFHPTAAIGGFAGVTVTRSIQLGVARSVFSNEAGWGSSPIIHASVNVDHPARQGLWGAMEVFIDTMIVCSISGLMVIITGAWETGRGGAGAVGEALSSVFGPSGAIALAFFIVIFSLTTTTGWFSYLESIIIYCVSSKTHDERMKYVKFVRFTGPLVPLGVSMFFFYHGTVPSIVWMMLDIQSGIPVYVNVIALTLLSPIIFKVVREFETNYLDPEKAARKTAKLAKNNTRG
jgi:AGCS family alanine or glycine:cation symporter